MSDIGEEKRDTTHYEDAMEALRRAQSALPDFTTSYDGQIRRLYDEIVARPAFRYDPVSDPLYQSYRTQMVTEGERAMRDTVGQAAHLTGGYGSSYAEGVGQQQYGLYLRRLGQVMPELYKAAYERYSAEGDELYRRFDTALGLRQDEAGRAMERYNQALRLEQQVYDREQDRLSREAAQEQQAYDREQDRLNREAAQEKQAYDREQDRLNREAAQEKLNYERSEKSYQRLVTLISQSGYSPSDAELAAAGMSRSQADALRMSYYRNSMSGLGSTLGSLGGSASGSRSTGSSGSSRASSAGGYARSAAPYAGISSAAVRTSSAAGTALTGTTVSKEQIKLAANQQGSNARGKTRRL